MNYGYIAIIAVVIPAISLIWKIVNSIKKKQGKVKVNYKFGEQRLFRSATGKLESPIPLLLVEIINKGESIRYMDDLKIKLPKKNGKNKYLVIINSDVENSKKFPYQLNSYGGKFEELYNLYDLQNALKKLDEREKIQILVKDTVGKCYTSPKIKIKAINNYIKQSMRS